MDNEKEIKSEKTSPEKPSLPGFGLAEDVLGMLENPSGPAAKPEAESNADQGGATPDAIVRGDADQKYVTFFLDDEEYGLPIFQVQEINRVGDITRVPNAPSHVRGVVNLRGKIVPVIELKRRLNLGDTHINKHSRIVVVEKKDKVLGLMVDRVAQVQTISADQKEEAPQEVVRVEQNFIASVGKIDGRMIILLDLDKIIERKRAEE